MKCPIDDNTIREIARRIFGVECLNSFKIAAIRAMVKTGKLKQEFKRLPRYKRELIEREYPQVLKAIGF